MNKNRLKTKGFFFLMQDKFSLSGLAAIGTGKEGTSIDNLLKKKDAHWR